MSSETCSSEHNNEIDPIYHKNQVRSITCLVVLALILTAAVIFSLWAGSYDTPIGELLRGIFNRSSDPKINVVVRNVRLPESALQ